MLILPDSIHNKKIAETFAYKFFSSLHDPDVICFPSVYHTNTKLDTSCIFSQTEPPQPIDAWPRYGSFVQCVSLNNTTRHCTVQKPQRDSALLRLPTCALIH